MALCNTVKIKHRGEVLACIDPSEIKAVEPYIFSPRKSQNPFKKLRNFISSADGRSDSSDDYPQEAITKVMFKDGTWMRIKIPFFDFINEYC